MKLRHLSLLLFTALVAAAFGPRLAQREATNVDIELVLAVDISYSMDPEEQALQREGYALALTSREFMQALAQRHPRQDRHHLFRMGGRKRAAHRHAVARDRRAGDGGRCRQRNRARRRCAVPRAPRSPAR